MKVKQLENKNQFVIIDDEHDVVFFQSYESLVAKYNYKSHKLTLGKDWHYGSTTLKFLYIFMRTYTNIRDLDDYSNKRKYVEKLIDDGVVLYDEEMK